MKISGNTILITGGGTGIGRALAEALQAEGNEIVIAGRRQSVLDEALKANPKMKALVLDIEDPTSIVEFAAKVAAEFPKLNVVIHNAGVMKPENVKATDAKLVEQTIGINLLGPIRLTAALLPQLEKQESATIMTVSSGLAFVPLAMAATYCATKAAIHSYTQSLRYQLKDTKIEVLELVPPYVQTELMGEAQAKDPRAMPLDAFIEETMEILKTQPEAQEICVKTVYPLRFAAEGGKYEAFFTGFNDAMKH
jgi:uncharacterized oxidoreductase